MSHSHALLGLAALDFWCIVATLCAGFLVATLLVQRREMLFKVKIGILLASGISFGVFLSCLL